MAGPACIKGASAAKSFIQIASRGYSTAIVRPSHLLEFLVPRTTPIVNRHASDLLHISNSSRLRNEPARNLRRTSLMRQPQQRFFTFSANQRATTCVLNPQTDEDGKEMMLEITPRAAKRLSEIMKKDGNPHLALRIQVESGGCHGFQYLMSLVTIPPKGTKEWSSVVNEDDAIFQFFPDNAMPPSSLEAGSATIILDEPSLDLLKGSKVDFTMELIGSQFKIVDNPYATSSCGCGTSFDIKM